MKETQNYSVTFDQDGRCTLRNKENGDEYLFECTSQLVNFCHRIGIEVLVENGKTCNR